jgi:hypothetical protein
MCKKLMFLISLVLLLGVAAGAYADDLEVDCGETYTVSGTENYDEMDCAGTVIVPSGAVLNLSNRSKIDGCDECDAGQMATVIVEGEMYITDRMDIGDGEDGHLHVRNGGIFEQSNNSDGFKLPDNSGGCHFITVEGAGSRFRAVRIEAIPGRDAHIDLCDGGCVEIENRLESPCYRHDPLCWIPDGTMTHCGGVGDPLIVTNDIPVSGGATVCAPAACDDDKASNPSPEDGETGVKCVITEVVLEWGPSCPVLGCPMCRHFVFFGDDCQDVEDAPMFSIGWTPPPEYQGWVPGAVTTWNLGNLPLWTNYCWRIDEGPMGPIQKGDVWTFTTGCPLINGDLNLNCLLNLEDYSILLESFGEEQYFPWD